MSVKMVLSRKEIAHLQEAFPNVKITKIESGENVIDDAVTVTDIAKVLQDIKNKEKEAVKATSKEVQETVQETVQEEPDVIFSTQTKEEMLKTNKEKAESSAGKTTIIARNLKRNPDLVVLVLLILIATAFGYTICRFKFGLTLNDIKLGLTDFMELIGFLVGTLGLAILKLYTKAGPIVESLQKTSEKENLDEYGRTILKKG